MPQLARYMKQIMLKDFGLESQMKLYEANVLVVGCGGLGCPVLSSLNAMGIGTLGFIDFDVVDETNLHRQFLYHHSDIGTPKVDVISTRLAAQNPATRLVPIQEKLTVSNSLTLFNSYDIIVDATDNFESRYMINDACMLLQKPLVYGAVFSHQGQVAVFNTAHNGFATSYRDAFPHVPKAGEIPSCDEAGVLGVYPSLIGNFQANEVVKLITGKGLPLIHQLLMVDFQRMHFYTLEIHPSGQDFSLTMDEFLHKDYQLSCSL